MLLCDSDLVLLEFVMLSVVTSKLGPDLGQLFNVDDISDNIPTEDTAKLFADDTKIYSGLTDHVLILVHGVFLGSRITLNKKRDIKITVDS